MIRETGFDIEFKEFDESVFELSQKWLSDPEIKELTLTPDTTRDERIKWFHSLKIRTDYLIKGVFVNGIPIGVAGLKKVDYGNKTGEYFGYIGDKDFIGHGIGKKMISYIVDIGKDIGLQSIILNVSDNNSRAIRLYEKTGFSIFLKNENIITMHKNLLQGY